MFYRPLWIVPCALALLAVPAFSEEEKDAKKELEEKERLEAQQEEKSEQEKTSLAYETVTLKGTLTLNALADGETNNTPVGTFATLKGEFQLKFEDMQLRKELLAQNGKVVTFTGKLRNQGKYFIVLRYEGAPKNVKPPPRISPGGL